MFRWYRDAARCYVYLSDVSAIGEEGRNRRTWKEAFRRSRWFTRGWTLQELIAPASVQFFSAEGEYLGDKVSLETLIHNITGIPRNVLRGYPLSQFSLEERISWVGSRNTKHEEDVVYSLFGIFDIAVPLIYGEGRIRAWRRLRKEISETYNVELEERFVESNISHESSDMRTPSSWMARPESKNLSDMLFERGTTMGWLPLINATEQGQERIVKLLLDHGAPVNSSIEVYGDDSEVVENGNTALHKAVSNSSIQIVRLLLSYGAAVNLQGTRGKRPLHITAQNNNEDIARLLLEHGAQVNARDAEGRTALFEVPPKGEALVKLLLENGADINARDMYGGTALFRASCGDKARVALLLERGAAVDMEDNKGWTPLHLAVQEGHDEITMLLIEYRARIESKDLYGRTALYWAARCGHMSIAKLFIQHKAKIDLADNNRRTPLYWAVRNGHYAVGELLQEHGASILIRAG